QDSIDQLNAIYQERRDIAVQGLKTMGLNIQPPKGSFYVWAPVPKGYTSTSFAEYMLEKAHVIVTPGNGYGEHGEGYFRIALTVDKDRMQTALERMAAAL